MIDAGRKNSSGAGLFLMEMIMVVGFFILCASICISVFVKANQLSQDAQDTNRGVLMAQSLAEIWGAEGIEGLETRFQALAPEPGNPQSYVCSWGQDWEAVSDPAAAVYCGRLELTRLDLMENLHISIRKGRGNDFGRTLYELETNRYHKPE